MKLQNNKLFKAPQKSLKLISHFKRGPNGNWLEANESWKEEFERSFTDDIQVLDGSFSKLKPIGFRRQRKPSTPSAVPGMLSVPGTSSLPSISSVPGPSSLPSILSVPGKSSVPDVSLPGTSKEPQNSIFKPNYTSTPNPEYEDITDEETEVIEVQQEHQDSDSDSDSFVRGDINETFSYEHDVENERIQNQEYWTNVEHFLNVNNVYLEAKSMKKVELYRKAEKYKRKLKHVQAAIEELEKAIDFSVKIPQLLRH